MTRTYLIQVIIFKSVSADVAFGVNHRVGVLQTILLYLVTAIFKICVKHCFEFNPHHIAPLRPVGEVEHVRLWHAFHFRGCHPLAIVFVGFLDEAKTTVDVEIFEVDIACLSFDRVAFGHTVEAAVLYIDVVHVGACIKRYNLYSILALLTGNVVQVDVAHCGKEAAAANLVMFIIEVDFQYRFSALSHLDVAGIDVLYDTATASVGLDSYYAVQIRAVHHVVFSEHVTASSRDLTANDDASVPVLHLAVADDDVLTGLVPQTAVVVASALDGDTVVTGVEETVFYQHSVA